MFMGKYASHTMKSTKGLNSTNKSCHIYTWDWFSEPFVCKTLWLKQHIQYNCSYWCICICICFSNGFLHLWLLTILRNGMFLSFFLAVDPRKSLTQVGESSIASQSHQRQADFCKNRDSIHHHGHSQQGVVFLWNLNLRWLCHKYSYIPFILHLHIGLIGQYCPNQQFQGCEFSISCLMYFPFLTRLNFLLWKCVKLKPPVSNAARLFLPLINYFCNGRAV